MEEWHRITLVRVDGADLPGRLCAAPPLMNQAAGGERSEIERPTGTSGRFFSRGVAKNSRRFSLDKGASFSLKPAA
jgi:hypothetical protein